MKRLRHLFWIYNTKEKDFLKKKESILKEQIAKVEERAENVANKEYAEIKAMSTRLNDICPKCESRLVVDKITRLQSEGSISWNFFLGSWGIYWSSSMDTNEVNNCNDCWHQRKKYKLTRNSKSDVIRMLMRYIDRCRYKGGEKYMTIDSVLAMKSMWIYKETLNHLNKEYNYWRYISLDDLDRLEYPKMSNI